MRLLRSFAQPRRARLRRRRRRPERRRAGLRLGAPVRPRRGGRRLPRRGRPGRPGPDRPRGAGRRGGRGQAVPQVPPRPGARRRRLDIPEQRVRAAEAAMAVVQRAPAATWCATSTCSRWPPAAGSTPTSSAAGRLEAASGARAPPAASVGDAGDPTDEPPPQRRSRPRPTGPRSAGRHETPPRSRRCGSTSWRRDDPTRLDDAVFRTTRWSRSPRWPSPCRATPSTGCDAIRGRGSSTTDRAPATCASASPRGDRGRSPDVAAFLSRLVEEAATRRSMASLQAGPRVVGCSPVERSTVAEPEAHGASASPPRNEAALGSC